MFQEHTWRHYMYLQDSIPDMIPQLQSCGIDLLEKDEGQTRSDSTTVFIQKSVNQLENISTLDNTTAKQMLETAVRDLQRVSELDVNTAASAECICLFLQSQLLISRLMSQHAHIVTGSVTVNNINVLVEKVLDLTNKLQTLFLGLGNNDLALIRQTELKALTFRLGSVLANSQELATQMKSQDAFTSYLTSLQKFLSSSDSTQDSCTSFLLAELSNLKTLQLSAAQNILHSALKLVRPVNFCLNNKVRKARALIHEPAKISDNPIKFTAGLTTAVFLLADIENVSDVSNIRLQVQYPDTSSVLIVPPPQDFKKLNVLHHQLSTKVLLSHGHWSESCAVEIGLVLLSSAVQMKFRSQASCSTDQDEKVIELCKPVKVLVAPKPFKR